MKKAFTPQQKAAVALEALRGDKTISQIASIYEVHPTRIQQRDIELGWLKKNCTLSHEKRKDLIIRRHAGISISGQAELLGISRSSIYYAPFYGSRRMKDALADDCGIHIGRHQTRRLMRLMGLEAIYPREKPQTSASEPSHRKYPYLLRGLPIVRPNQVRVTDITYLRLEEGWAYLVAILDWYSRYVVARDISPTLESDFCIAALNEALQKCLLEILPRHQRSQRRPFRILPVLQPKTPASVIGQPNTGGGVPEPKVEY